MLSASKELGMIKMKRKKSFKSFDPLKNNEERKEQQKITKIGYERNKRITKWLIPKESKKLDKEKRNAKDRNKK